MQRNITWKEVWIAVDTLASMLKESSIEIDCVVAVARGGFVPAYLLGRALGIKDLTSISVCYRHPARTKPDIYCVPDFTNGPNSVILVEDQVEIGRSMSCARDFLRKKVSKVSTCALFAWQGADYRPQFVSEMTLEKRGVIFPWEHKFQ